MDLADKLKTALDESRLLILGAQVVFGCQFQMVFQEGFQDAPRDSQAVQGLGLLAGKFGSGQFPMVTTRPLELRTRAGTARRDSFSI